MSTRSIVSDAVTSALAERRPVVALESTIISHALPRPRNHEAALEFEQTLLDAGVTHATVAVLDGVPRGASSTFDESADLSTLAITPITVVSAGVKSVLDIAATLEWLEALSVLVDGQNRSMLTERGVQVSVDPASAGFLDPVDGAALLFPNLDEGRVLTGLEKLQDVAVALSERFDVVALTLGETGAVVSTPNGSCVHVQADPVAVVDPTGAGDAFAAGFLARWCI